MRGDRVNPNIPVVMTVEEYHKIREFDIALRKEMDTYVPSRFRREDGVKDGIRA